MTKTPDFVLYGSGDVGTKELRATIERKRANVQFLDIRDPWMNRQNLRRLQRLKLRTVPQIFDHEGNHLGDFDRAKAELLRLPDAPSALDYA